jgi:hypothetical protein
LVPANAIERRPLEANTIFELQRIFDVSVEVAARAVAAVTPRLGVALWYWPADGEVGAGSLVDQWSTSSMLRDLRSWRKLPALAEALTKGAAKAEVSHPTRRGQTMCCALRCDAERRQIAMTVVRKPS